MLLYLSHPKVFPSVDLCVEGISRAGSVDQLPVPMQGEGGNQSLATDGAGCQPISHQLHGVLGRQAGGIVANKGDPVAFGVVTLSVGSLPGPPSAFIEIAVRACHEAGWWMVE